MSYDRRTLYSKIGNCSVTLQVTNNYSHHLPELQRILQREDLPIKVDPLNLELLIQAIKHFRSQVPQSKFEANR